MYKNILLIMTGMTLILTAAGMLHAGGQSSMNYTVESDVVSAGGGESGSTNYFIEHTTGQSSATGESSGTTCGNYAGFWNVLYADLPSVTYSVSGYGMNTPASPKWRASMAVNVDGAAMTGLLRYYYTRQRVSFNSTSIASVTSPASGTVRITGRGDGTRITGNTTTHCTDCTFTATIQDGSPDGMDFVITAADSSAFYNAPGGLTALDGGSFTVTEH
jgi:hypothetical protein